MRRSRRRRVLASKHSWTPFCPDRQLAQRASSEERSPLWVGGWASARGKRGHQPKTKNEVAANASCLVSTKQPEWFGSLVKFVTANAA